MVKGLLLAIAGVIVVAAHPALAQQAVPGIDNAIAKRQQRIGTNHWKFTGDATDPVVIKIGDAEVYTDEIEVFTDQDRVDLGAAFKECDHGDKDAPVRGNVEIFGFKLLDCLAD